MGVDLEVQQWSDVGTDADPFNNFSKLAAGISWVPDFDNVSSYFKRAKYSIGFNRTRLPYIVNDQALTDFGINFGASLPVSGFSSVDLGVKWGQLGFLSNMKGSGRRSFLHGRRNLRLDGNKETPGPGTYRGTS